MITKQYQCPIKKPLIGQFFIFGPLVFLIPLLFSTSTIDPVLSPRFYAWSVFTLFLCVSVFLESRWHPNRYDFSKLKRPIFFVFVCHLAFAAVSLTQTINLSEGLFEWLKLCLSFIFFSISCLVIKGDRYGIRKLAKVLIVLGTLLSVIGICQNFGIAFTSIPGNYVIYLTMAHKNLFASALFLILPFVLFGIYSFPGIWQIVSKFALSGICLSMLLTRSRTVWVAIISATLFLTIVCFSKNRKTGDREFFKKFDVKKCLNLFSAGLIISFCFIYIYSHNDFRFSLAAGENKISTFQADPFSQTIFSLGTLKERIWLWKNSIEVVKKNPLMGVGLGQWRLIFPVYGKVQKFRQSDDGRAEIFFQSPQNDFIWVLSETGIIGLLSYLSILGIAIFYALKFFFKSNDTDNRALAIFMLFGIIGYMVIAFFSFPKERIVHNIFLMLILACIVSTYHRTFPKPKVGRCSSILFFNILVVFLLCFCVIVGCIRLNSEIHVKEALAARREGDWKKVISEIDKADSPFYQLDPASVPLAWYQGNANYSMEQFGKALDDFKKAYQIHPNHIHVLNNLGTGYAQAGDYENAAKYYKKALDVCPGFAEARINLGVLYFHMGAFA